MKEQLQDFTVDAGDLRAEIDELNQLIIKEKEESESKLDH